MNAELTLLFWRVGQRIHTEVLAGQRARYGEEILPTLAAQLVRDYGHSLADKNLRRMVQFAAAYPDEPIVVTLSRQLSWSHFLALLPLRDPLQRDYYAQMACAERWSERTLRDRIAQISTGTNCWRGISHLPGSGRRQLAIRTLPTPAGDCDHGALAWFIDLGGDSCRTLHPASRQR